MITESAIDRLMTIGIKPSLQRVAIMQYLLDNRTHPTVDEIYSGLQPNMPTLSRTTVYNTLKLLSDKGAVLTLDIDKNQSRYDGNISLHGHFLCTKCGHIEDLFIEQLDILKQFHPDGAEIRDVQLLYKGVCKNCK